MRVSLSQSCESVIRVGLSQSYESVIRVTPYDLNDYMTSNDMARVISFMKSRACRKRSNLIQQQKWKWKRRCFITVSDAS